MKKYCILSIIAFVTVIRIAGCDVVQSDSEEPAQLVVQMQTPNDGVQNEMSVTNSAITVDEIKLHVERLNMQGSQNDSLDFGIENLIVNLPLDGSPLEISRVETREGIYENFTIEVTAPGDEAELNDPDFRDDSDSFSVVVNGTFNEEPFTFRSARNFEIDLDLSLEVADSENSMVVISVNVPAWFRRPNGNDLDPNRQNNYNNINNNIANSFQIPRDDEEEDEDDENEGDDDE